MPAPTLFTEEIAAEICENLALGVTLAEMCRRLEIGRTTVYDWAKSNEAFKAQLAEARTAGFDAIAEEALEIADDGRNDWVERQEGEGEPKREYNGDHVQRSRLRVDTRLKLLAKWDPRYSDRTTVDLTGGVTVKHDVADGEAAARLAAILEAARRRRDEAADGEDEPA